MLAPRAPVTTCREPDKSLWLRPAVTGFQTRLKHLCSWVATGTNTAGTSPAQGATGAGRGPSQKGAWTSCPRLGMFRKRGVPSEGVLCRQGGVSLQGRLSDARERDSHSSAPLRPAGGGGALSRPLVPFSIPLLRKVLRLQCPPTQPTPETTGGGSTSLAACRIGSDAPSPSREHAPWAGPWGAGESGLPSGRPADPPQRPPTLCTPPGRVSTSA